MPGHSVEPGSQIGSGFAGTSQALAKKRWAMKEERAVEAVGGKGRLGEEVIFPEVTMEYPGWVRRQVDWTRTYPGQRDRMRVALAIARLNVEQKTGGPFGAAVFEAETGRLISIGMNQVIALSSTLFHAEMMARSE